MASEVLWEFSSGWGRCAVRRVEVIEGDRGTARKCIHQYATVTRHSSSRDHVVGEPLAAASGEIVVPNALAARRRVDEAAASGIDRNVADPPSLRKQQQITDGE